MKVDMYSQFDHIRPAGMDGKNIPSNIQALCPGCHSAKTREDRLRIKKWKEKHKPKTDKEPPKKEMVTVTTLTGRKIRVLKSKTQVITNIYGERVRVLKD